MGHASGDRPEPLALSVLALVGLVRVVTNPRIFRRTAMLREAFAR
jgi:hypothetical protein